MNRLRWKGLAFLFLLTSLLILGSCMNSSNVKVGLIAPINGNDLFSYGFQIDNGVKVALDEIQKLRDEGKIRKNYELIWENESEDVEEVKAAFERLRKQGVTAIIGATYSASTLALAELANKHKILLLSPASSSPEINQGNPDYVFRNYPSDTLEAQKLANVIFQKCLIQKCLMIRSRNTFAEGITFELLRFARGNPNLQIPNEVVKFGKESGSVDFASVIERVVELKPHAVFLGAYNESLLPLIREIRAREELKDTYIFTSSAFVPEKAVKELGEAAVEGVMFTGYRWNPQESVERIQKFARDFQTKATVAPTIYAASGYDAMIILAQAIDGVNHSIRDDIRTEIAKGQFGGKLNIKEEDITEEKLNMQLLLGETEFNKRGDVTRIPLIYRMTEGHVVELTDEDMDGIKRSVLSRFE